VIVADRHRGGMAFFFLAIIKRGLFDGQKSLPAAVTQNKD